MILALSIGSSLVLSSCKHENYVKAGVSDTNSDKDLTSIAEPTTETTPLIIDSSNEAATKNGNDAALTGLLSTISTYKDGNISIQYPVISNLEDTALLEKINTLLKNNALTILNAYAADPQKDSLTIESKVISLDRKRITVVYTGLYYASKAAYPINIFYTNTVDTALAQDIGLSDYVDPDTLAQYVRSDDCQLYDASSELTQALKTVRADTSQETFSNIFKQADFPIKKNASNKSPVFPESFSYEDKGSIIFSIPVSHALGDYALIEYTPETK